VSSSPAAPPVESPGWRLPAALAAVYFIWGSTYYVMRLVVHGLPPLLSGSLRFLAAGGALLAISRARGAAWPTARQWRLAWPIGALLFVVGNGFVAIALTAIPSSVVTMVVATMPLWAAVIATGFGQRSTAREWLGLLVGFGGVVVLVGEASIGGGVVHWAAIIVSPIGWALGSLLTRRLPLPDGTMGTALQMVTGGASLGVVGLALGERIDPAAPASSWAALAYLAVLGSLVAFSAYGWLLRNTRPAVATSYAYVNPAIAVLIGVTLGGEPLTTSTAAAGGLILGAVVLVVAAKR
jgi:drug/metabolite transporter (DMT)-like permease